MLESLGAPQTGAKTSGLPSGDWLWYCHKSLYATSCCTFLVNHKEYYLNPFFNFAEK